MKYMEFFAGLLGKADALGVPRNNDVDIMKFVNLALWVAGIIAVIVVIIAGINYSLSSGDPAKTASAKNASFSTLVLPLSPLKVRPLVSTVVLASTPFWILSLVL